MKSMQSARSQWRAAKYWLTFCDGDLKRWRRSAARLMGRVK